MKNHHFNGFLIFPFPEDLNERLRLGWLRLVYFFPWPTSLPIGIHLIKRPIKSPTNPIAIQIPHYVRDKPWGEQARGLFPNTTHKIYRTIIRITILINIELSKILAKIFISSYIFLEFKKLNIYIQTKALKIKVKCLEAP